MHGSQKSWREEDGVEQVPCSLEDRMWHVGKRREGEA